MSERVEVRQDAPHCYAVTVSSGAHATHHLVRVPESLWGVDEVRLVRESFGFLLKREPATAILATFSLDAISRYFPEYAAEILARL